MALRSTLKLYPDTNPEALTACLKLVGTDFGLLADTDFALANVMAAR